MLLIYEPHPHTTDVIISAVRGRDEVESYSFSYDIFHALKIVDCCDRFPCRQMREKMHFFRLHNGVLLIDNRLNSHILLYYLHITS